MHIYYCPCVCSCGSLASVMRCWTLLCVLVFSPAGLGVSGVSGVSAQLTFLEMLKDDWSHSIFYCSRMTPQGTEHNPIYFYVDLGFSVCVNVCLWKLFYSMALKKITVWWREIVFRPSHGCDQFSCTNRRANHSVSIRFIFSDFYVVRSAEILFYCLLDLLQMCVTSAAKWKWGWNWSVELLMTKRRQENK